MNPSLLTSPPSSSPFLNPLHASSSFSLPRRRRFRVSVPRCSSETPPTTDTSSALALSDVFGGKRELTGIQPLVESLSPPARLASSAIILAGALAAGYGLGLRFTGSRNLALGGAAAMGAAGGAMVYALNSVVPEVAAAGLHNYVAGCDDPQAIRKEDVEAIAKKYGVSKQDAAFNEELCDIYCRYVSSALPPGSEDLKGTEAETIINFKNALGIDDPDAANMHVEIGRHIFRQRLETGDRDGDVEQRRAFQKLVYVSTLVFGEASAFLLPWKRVFKVTDSQVEIAIRDNAQRLYASKLKSVGRDIDVEQLRSLRQAQLAYRLSDELADDAFRQYTRELIEQNISEALNMLKSRTRANDAVQVVQELDKILAFNNKLISLKNHPDAASFARGVGPVSVLGGEFDGNRKIDDLKLLYRAYIADALSGGRMEENKLSALNQLRNIFGLGKREAEAITLDVTSKVYRKRLAKAFSSGTLDSADSKAYFLQNLCEELCFDTEKATEIHEEIYRQKLQQCTVDGELSDEDVAALNRLRVLLCIPEKTIDAVHADICGSLFEKVLKDALSAGADDFEGATTKAVRKAAHGLRLTQDAAMAIASKAVRRSFINLIKQARSGKNPTEVAEGLKKLVGFNKLVVTPLIAEIKGESEASSQEPVKEEEKLSEVNKEWESLGTLKKLKPSKEMGEKMGNPGQTQITLRDDLPAQDRADLYKTYLLYCLTGDAKMLPLGGRITSGTDDTEYITLSTLGGILGLTINEIVEVHKGLAEKAFRQKAEVVLADGQLTKARIEHLNDLQKEVGLPEESAQKIIKSITATKIGGALEAAISRGKLDIKQIRELKETNIEVDDLISEKLRVSLFRKTVDEIFSSGTGEFDEEEVYEKLPAELNINVEKAKELVHELARSRLSNSLIQAVSLLRQRNNQGVVSTLNNMLACDKALPSEPLTWEIQEELADLYTVYYRSEPKPEKLSRIQYLLGISDSTAATLREMKERAYRVEEEEEEEEFVF